MAERRIPEPAVTLDHLWAGWRSQYVTSASAPDPGPESAGPTDTPGDDPAHCVFCRIAASGPPSEENGVLWVGAHTLAVLNAYPYASGHLMVMPIRHVAPSATSPRRRGPSCGRRSGWEPRPWRRPIRPEGVNLGANLGRAAGAGIPRHLHLHAVPRWVGDTNFMTAVADTRVLPEALDASWHRLHRVWPA